MIYILTLHFKNRNWYNIQKRYLEKYTRPDDYKVIMGLFQMDVPDDCPKNFQPVNLNHVRDNHKDHMSFLCEIAKQQMKDDDILIFMDGDAFPICDWVGKLKGYLSENEVVSIFRQEDLGMYDDPNHWPAPHLSFTASTKKTWVENDFQWDLGKYQCPGYTILDKIEAKSIKLKKLLRSNKYNAHNVMFGVYDDMIYHNGNGSTASAGIDSTHRSRTCYEGSDLTYRRSLHNGEFETSCPDIMKINHGIFAVVFNEIKNDMQCKIISRYFVGKEFQGV